MGRNISGVEVKKNRFFIILKSRNLSIQKLADKTGYTRQGISKAIHAGKMDPKMLDDIAKYLDISPDFLTGEYPLKKFDNSRLKEFVEIVGKGYMVDDSGYEIMDYQTYTLAQSLRPHSSSVFLTYDALEKAFYALIKEGILNRGEWLYPSEDFIKENYHYFIPGTYSFMRRLVRSALNKDDDYKKAVSEMEEMEIAEKTEKDRVDYYESFFEVIPPDQEPDE